MRRTSWQVLPAVVAVIVLVASGCASGPKAQEDPPQDVERFVWNKAEGVVSAGVFKIKLDPKYTWESSPVVDGNVEIRRAGAAGYARIEVAAHNNKPAINFYNWELANHEAAQVTESYDDLKPTKVLLVEQKDLTLDTITRPTDQIWAWTYKDKKDNAEVILVLVVRDTDGDGGANATMRIISYTSTRTANYPAYQELAYSVLSGIQPV